MSKKTPTNKNNSGKAKENIHPGKLTDGNFRLGFGHCFSFSCWRYFQVPAVSFREGRVFLFCGFSNIYPYFGLYGSVFFFFPPHFPPQKQKQKQKTNVVCPPTGYQIPNKKHHGVLLEVGPGYPFRKGVPAWRTIPVSKWLVTPIYKPVRPFGRGPTTLLRGLTITMVINH